MDPGPSKSTTTKADAKSITDRWEVPFVYGFVMKFAPSLKKKLDLNSPMDFEDALLAPGRSPALTGMLDHFLHNLWWKQAKPKCDCRPEAIERTLATLFSHYCTLKEHSSTLWSKTEGKNVNPLSDGVGFYSLNWSSKLRILRQLVEWQLTYCDAVKAQIDLAWGVKHSINQKGKQTEQEKIAAKGAKGSKAKGAPTAAELEAASAAKLKEQLEIRPIGIDYDKQRFWAVDESPRVWTSGNPWKNTCEMITVSSTRSELTSLEASIRSSQPPVVAKAKRGRFALSHDALVTKMEEHLPRVDEELARLERAERKQQAKLAAEARFADLAAMRETRSTRAARKQVDYRAVEQGNAGSDGDDDVEMLDEDNDDASDLSSLSEYDDDNATAARRSSRQTSRSVKTSRASSTAPSITSQKRKTGDAMEWRGERRSSRISGGRYQLEDEENDEQAEFTSTNSERAAKRRRIMSNDPEDSKPDAAENLPSRAVILGGPKMLQPRGIAPDGSTDGDTPSLISDRKTSCFGGSDTSSLSSLSDDEGF